MNVTAPLPSTGNTILTPVLTNLIVKQQTLYGTNNISIAGATPKDKRTLTVGASVEIHVRPLAPFFSTTMIIANARMPKSEALPSPNNHYSTQQSVQNPSQLDSSLHMSMMDPLII